MILMGVFATVGRHFILIRCISSVNFLLTMQHRKHVNLEHDLPIHNVDLYSDQSKPNRGFDMNVAGPLLLTSWLLQFHNLLSYPQVSLDRSSQYMQLAIIGLLSILLLLYALDLVGHRTLLLSSIWILGVGLSSLIFLFIHYYINTTIYHHSTFSWVLLSTWSHAGIDASVWLCLACWACLQFKWKNELLQDENSSFDIEFPDKSSILPPLTNPLFFQRLLCTVLPLSFACTCTRSLFQWLIHTRLVPGDTTFDRSTLALPLTHAEIGIVSSIFGITWIISDYSLTSRLGSFSRFRFFHRWKWISPLLLYLVFQSFGYTTGAQLEDKWWLDEIEKYSLEKHHTRYLGIMSVPSYLWDSILLLCLPFFLDQYFIHCRSSIDPSFLNRYISTRVRFFMSLLTVVAMEFRLLIPCVFCSAHAIHGKIIVQPIWLTSICLGTSIMCFGISAWFYGQTANGELIGGDYHDDIFQALVIIACMSGAMAFALPFKAFPFVFVAALSLSLFICTRMARFMFLFVLTMSSLAYAGTFYRFYHIGRNVDIIPGYVSVTLHQLSLLIIGHAAAWGTLIAMFTRTPHRFGESFIQRHDLKGILFSFTVCLLFLIEVCLLTNNIGYLSRDIFQHEVRAIYHPTLVITTSLLISLFGWTLSTKKQMQTTSYLIATSLCITKAFVALLLLLNKNPSTLGRDLQRTMLKQSAIIFVICMAFLFTLPRGIHRFLRTMTNIKRIKGN